MAFKQPEEFILLSTLTASASASLSFTSLITSTYPVYYIKIRSLIPATNATNLLMTYSTDNGATYLNTNYLWSNYHFTSNGAPSQTTSTSDSSVHIAETMSNTSSKGGLNMNIELFGFGQAVVPTLQGIGGLQDSNGFSQGVLIGGLNTGTTAINAVKFAMSAGNISSGTISLYGQVI